MNGASPERALALESAGMFEAYLALPNTVTTGKGEGLPVELPADAAVLLLTARIGRIVEQEALRLLIWGSSDGTTWDAKPLLEFPELFYSGEYPLLWTPGANERPRFVRATWEAHRWGRGSETPYFEFSLQIRSVPPDLARELKLQ